MEIYGICIEFKNVRPMLCTDTGTWSSWNVGVHKFVTWLHPDGIKLKQNYS